MEAVMTDKEAKKLKEVRLQTQLVRGGLYRSKHGETSEAIFMNSGFVFESAEQAEARFAGEEEGYLYSRYGNPTVTMFEKRMSLNEDTESCFATASGMSAVFASLMCQLKSGDEVISARSLFGSCAYIIDQILPRYGIITKLIDGTDHNQWEQSISNNTKCVFFETPSNPTMEIIDIQYVSNIAHQHGALVIVDNIFASPVLQKPIRYGADIVVYSGTKHIDGQGRSMGGAVLSNNEFREEYLKPFMRHSGPTISPFNAWILLKGLETLNYRMNQHCKNATKITEFLFDHKLISKIIYPGLETHPQYELAKKQMLQSGSIVTFVIKGGKENAFKFMNALEVFDISNNLGDTKSLVTHPATTTHRIIGEEGRKKLNIDDGMIRLSVGLEDIQDLIEDIEQALGKVNL